MVTVPPDDLARVERRPVKPSWTRTMSSTSEVLEVVSAEGIEAMVKGWASKAAKEGEREKKG